MKPVYIGIAANRTTKEIVIVTLAPDYLTAEQKSRRRASQAGMDCWCVMNISSIGSSEPNTPLAVFMRKVGITKAEMPSVRRLLGEVMLKMFDEIGPPSNRKET